MDQRNSIIIITVGSLLTLVVGMGTGLWYLFDRGYVMLRLPQEIEGFTESSVVSRQARIFMVQEGRLVPQPVDLTLHDQAVTGDILAELVRAWWAALRDLGEIADRCQLVETSYGAQTGVLFVTFTSAPWSKNRGVCDRWRYIQALCATIHDRFPDVVTALYLMQPDGSPLYDDYVYCGEPFQPAVHRRCPYIEDIAHVTPPGVKVLVGDMPLYEAALPGRYVGDVAERVIVSNLLASWHSIWPQNRLRTVQGTATGSAVSHVHTINRMRPSLSISWGVYHIDQRVPRISLYVYGHKATDGWRMVRPAGALIPFTQIHRYSVPASWAYAQRLAAYIQQVAGAHLQVMDIEVVPCASLVGRDHPSVYLEIGLADAKLMDDVLRLLQEALARLLQV